MAGPPARRFEAEALFARSRRSFRTAHRASARTKAMTGSDVGDAPRCTLPSADVGDRCIRVMEWSPDGHYGPGWRSPGSIVGDPPAGERVCRSGLPEPACSDLRRRPGFRSLRAVGPGERTRALAVPESASSDWGVRTRHREHRGRTVRLRHRSQVRTRHRRHCPRLGEFRSARLRSTRSEARSPASARMEAISFIPRCRRTRRASASCSSRPR
ncbi:hypothetical protein MetexDRAFT_1470 [Methylorubrum extorquens DSM 13060]|jgi:hypothetical protein|uniref:Uncharacterized protein n=1 Tax=Methylorubrum extorquens DSM 13060 TaxID=882800 RepID=H1KFQ8_METEX|nr:hypothetical protein MetexDRAFT_1470 [Methylorubrum extorquens DSM 13060]